MQDKECEFLEYNLYHYTKNNRIFTADDITKIGKYLIKSATLGDVISDINVYPNITDNGITEGIYLSKSKTIVIFLGNILTKYYTNFPSNYADILRLNMYILYSLLYQMEKAYKLKLAGFKDTFENKLLNMGLALEINPEKRESAIKDLLKTLSYCLSIRECNPYIRLSNIDAKINILKVISSNKALNIYYQSTTNVVNRTLRNGYGFKSPTEQFILYYQKEMNDSSFIFPNLDNYTLEEKLRLGLPINSEEFKENIDISRILRK